MTRGQFVKVKFMAYMPINYIQPSNKEVIECLLVGIDFEDQLLTLEPVDKVYYKDEQFVARCENCTFPKSSIK
jgi:hypothetical protein